MFKLTDFLKKATGPSKKETYSKDPVVIEHKNEKVSVGDKVKLTPFYLSNYCGMNDYANKEAEVIKVLNRPISIDAVEKGDRAMYASLYGKQEAYDIVCYWVRYPGDSKIYTVSPFGYSKV